MQDLFDMKREELTGFLGQLVSDINKKNELEAILADNTYIKEAQEKLDQIFCDKNNESMVTFQGMLNNNDQSFLISNFARTFEQSPTSEKYRLLVEKANRLEQLRDTLVQNQNDFRFGSGFGTMGASILLIISIPLLAMSFTNDWRPLFKVLVILFFIGDLYLFYCTYKYGRYATRISSIEQKKGAVEVEKEKTALPYLKKMFEQAIEEWKADPHNVEIMKNAELKTKQIREQAMAIDLSNLQIIPSKFRELSFLQLFESYLQDGRADSWKECVNLYHQEVQFDENVRHHREQEEHNRQQSELQQQELWEQQRQSSLQQEQLNENIRQSNLQSQQLDEMANQSKIQNEQLKEARKQTANQGKQLNELQKHTKLGKIIGASSILQNAQLGSIHDEQREHDRWVEKGFRTKKEEEEYRRLHPEWSKRHPRQGYYR